MRDLFRSNYPVVSPMISCQRRSQSLKYLKHSIVPWPSLLIGNFPPSDGRLQPRRAPVQHGATLNSDHLQYMYRVEALFYAEWNRPLQFGCISSLIGRTPAESMSWRSDQIPSTYRFCTCTVYRYHILSIKYVLQSLPILNEAMTAVMRDVRSRVSSLPTAAGGKAFVEMRNGLWYWRVKRSSTGNGCIALCQSLH